MSTDTKQITVIEVHTDACGNPPNITDGWGTKNPKRTTAENEGRVTFGCGLFFPLSHDGPIDEMTAKSIHKCHNDWHIGMGLKGKAKGDDEASTPGCALCGGNGEVWDNDAQEMHPCPEGCTPGGPDGAVKNTPPAAQRQGSLI